MDGNEERQKSQLYEAFVIDFIRILVEKEGCTTTMVHELTDIKINLIGSLYRTHKIQSKHEWNSSLLGKNANRIGAIRRARKMAHLRTKYAETIQKTKESVERRKK